MPIELSDHEIARVREMLVLHYRRDIEIHRADREVFLIATDDNPVIRPALFWTIDGANFILTKIAPSTFRGRFYYTPRDQHTATDSEYSEVDTCVRGMLEARQSQPRA